MHFVGTMGVVRGDFEETCAASSNAKLHDSIVGSANGDRYESYDLAFSFASWNDERPMPQVLLRLHVSRRLVRSNFISQSNNEDAGIIAGRREDMSKSYVIEVGDDQAGLIIREEGERDYLFHAALDEYSALEGRRFANALLAERAAVAHALSRRRRRAAANNYEAFA
jgi:hypothetical protein